ncbi:OmpA family protein [Pontibacter sp. G13]|uniref:OmpA family protein n=1 Tax=Pontibacter sp. G13 TaxID=3074898 RepID=UPI002889FB33|nr:OmpA family protein [Pontibacter sp. G13]WNJ16641.1 OmpA family protein [Pontibacter sp. G13]
MKKFYMLWVLLLGALGGVAQPSSGFEIDTVYFGFDSFFLKEESKQSLDSLIGKFTSYPYYYVEVYGHTDSIGSDVYNLDLSEQRARAVALYLTEQGVSLDRITYEGLGTNKPVMTNDSYFGRLQNRRVDIAVVYTTENLVPEDTTPVVVEVVEELPPAPKVDTIYCDYKPFMINPAKQTVVFTPKGTKLVIPEQAFVTNSEELSVEMKEMFERVQMVESSMPTISKNGPLESPSMFAFTVKDGRRFPRINEGVTFEVELPAGRRDANMAVYKGNGGSRGGSRKKGKGASAMDAGDPNFPAVKVWKKLEGDEVRYLGKDKKYKFGVTDPGRYAVARPLYYSQNTPRDDNGIDIFVKFKGKRFPKTTSTMIMGETVKTYIPLKKESDRVYTAQKVKFVDEGTNMVLFAVQFDDDGNPWIIEREFKTSQAKGKSDGGKTRKKLKIKAKFRKIDKDDYQDILQGL